MRLVRLALDVPDLAADVSGVLDLRCHAPGDSAGRGRVEDGDLDAAEARVSAGSLPPSSSRRTRSTTMIPPTPRTSATTAITASQRGWVTLGDELLPARVRLQGRAFHRHLCERRALAGQEAFLRADRRARPCPAPSPRWRPSPLRTPSFPGRARRGRRTQPRDRARRCRDAAPRARGPFLGGQGSPFIHSRRRWTSRRCER